jgi:hypothetical protein
MRAASIAVMLLALAAPTALAHPERHAFFPDGSVGADPPGCDWFTRPEEPR